MLQESGRLALSDAWDQDQFEMPQREKLRTWLFLLELMAKMPYTMECLMCLEQRIRRFKSCKYTFLEKTFFSVNISSNLISFSLLGPPHSMLLSPLSNSRSVSLNDTYTVRFLVCIQNSPKNTGMFLTFCIEVRDLILHTRWCQGSQSWRCIQALRHRWCWMLHPCSWPGIGKRECLADSFGDFDWTFGWSFKILGCEYTKMLYKITRYYKTFQLPVSAVCENPVYVLLV